MIDRRAAGSKEGPVPGPVTTETQQDAAEAVREHLVSLRGGAPFLSSADSEILAAWLRAGHSVPRIVAALERVAENRRKRPTLVPFTLAKAKRYLTGSEPTPPAGAPIPALDPLRALADRIERSIAEDPMSEALLALADALRRLAAEGGPSTLDAAVGLFTRFHDDAWKALPPADRERRLTRAREELGELASLMPPEALAASVEELARAALRRGYPDVSARALAEALAAAGAGAHGGPR